MTAKELLIKNDCKIKRYFHLVSYTDVTEEDLIEFAQFHVEAFRKEIELKAEFFDFEGLEKITDNVYPLNNIK